MLLLATVFVTILSASCALDIKYGGPVAFSFPCNDNPRYLTQEYQVTEGNKTQWKGTFYVDQWVNSVNVKLDFVFDNAAIVEANPRSVHIIDLDGEAKKSFRLTTLQPLNKTTRIEFKVLGVEADKLPNVLSLNVNGLTLCDNKDRKTNVELIQGLKNEPTVTEVVKKRCGIRHPILSETKEIIDWPWKISLYHNEAGQWTLVCGGTLIGENKVMTAGKCVKDRDSGRLMVEVGQLNVTVKEFKLHNEFMESTLQNDIAVLKIDKASVGANEQRFPICLYSDWASKDNNVTSGAINRETQQFQKLRVEDSILCLENNRLEYGNYLSTKNFCIKSETNDTKILSGDGFYEEFLDQERNMFTWKLKGVASYTSKDPYFIFTDVSKYYTWIESNL